jgi:pimeloyl-ACP methyl ester carboxylesterase
VPDRAPAIPVQSPATASAAGRSRHYLKHDGLCLAGDEWGPPPATTVVLLHGGGQTRRSWSGAAREFSSAGYHVINMDARGHGESDWPADGRYNLDALADDVATVLSDASTPVVLVGASMGGVTALHYAATGRSPAVSAVVMVDIVPRVEQEGSDRIQAFMRAHAGGFASIDEAVEAVAAYYPHRARPKDSSGLEANLRRRGDGRLYWHWDPRLIDGPHALEPPDFGDPLLRASKSVTIPVLVVRGLRSDIVSDAGIEEFRGVIPHLEVCDIPQAGHMVAGDRNDVFNAGTLAFLRRHVPPR